MSGRRADTLGESADMMDTLDADDSQKRQVLRREASGLCLQASVVCGQDAVLGRLDDVAGRFAHDAVRWAEVPGLLAAFLGLQDHGLVASDAGLVQEDEDLCRWVTARRQLGEGLGEAGEVLDHQDAVLVLFASVASGQRHDLGRLDAAFVRWAQDRFQQSRVLVSSDEDRSLSADDRYPSAHDRSRKEEDKSKKTKCLCPCFTSRNRKDAVVSRPPHGGSSDSQ